MKRISYGCNSTYKFFEDILSRCSGRKVVVVVIFIFCISIQLCLSSQPTRKGKTSEQKSIADKKSIKLLVITVATNPLNDGFLLFNRSINELGHHLIVLGANKQWLGGDIKRSSGGGQKLNLFFQALKTYKNDKSLLITFVDSYDLIFNGEPKNIISRFSNQFQKHYKIVFAAESVCWPEPSLAHKYPLPLLGGEQFLNSGAFIGYASDLWTFFSDLFSERTIENKEDDQLILTKSYLNETKRFKFGLALDHKAQLFQNLYELDNQVTLDLSSDKEVKIVNKAYKTNPLILHANGPNKAAIYSYSNYLARSWTKSEGCRHCNKSRISIQVIHEPTILVALFILENTPFIENFFKQLVGLTYPKRKIHLYIYNQVKYHEQHVDSFVKTNYASSTVLTRKDVEHHRYSKSELSDLYELMSDEEIARILSLQETINQKCDYYFALDSIARLEAKNVIEELIEANRPIIAPLLSRPKKLWSNFWGEVDYEGYYKRSFDYIDLVERNRVGIWRVPLIMNAYLLKSSYIRPFGALNHSSRFKSVSYFYKPDPQDELMLQSGNLSINTLKCFRNIHDQNMRPPLAFSTYLRDIGLGMFMINENHYGYLIDPNTFDPNYKYSEFYQLINNPIDWSKTYMHENYSVIMKEIFQLEEPCPDVYWFPLVNERFCDELIGIMENYGQWSSGLNQDTRIEGGYENVPTRDIHLRQVGLHEMWMQFLLDFVMPVQNKQYIGYDHDPPQADLAFVVRYNPNEQSELRPHHDASTYTLNIALNSPGSDYEGGGCRFVRYNCSVVDSRKGWALIHPGRLTHYHEGLKVTNGTRYVMITFVDP